MNILQLRFLQLHNQQHIYIGLGGTVHINTNQLTNQHKNS